MRIFALTVALMLAHPVTAFEPETNGVFSQRVISIVEQVKFAEQFSTISMNQNRSIPCLAT